jgi:hypothetical protein
MPAEAHRLVAVRMRLTRDRGIWIAVAGFLGLYGVGLPVGLFVASAQGTHVDWTAGPEIGAYVALAITIVIVGGIIIVGTTDAAAAQSTLQPTRTTRPSPPEMHFTIHDGTYGAPLLPGEITSASAIGPDGELLGVMRSEYLSTSLDLPALDATAPSGPANTVAWRHTTEGMEAVGAMHSIQKRLAHPSDAVHGPGIPPAIVTLGLRLASDPLGTELSASELRAAFLGFLGRPPMLSLVNQITAIPGDACWSSYGGNGRLMLGAILGDPDDEQNAPSASALVNFCNHQSRTFQDPRSSELVLCVEPRDATGTPASSVPLRGWHQRLVTALDIPGAFARFLTDEVRLQTHDQPPVQLGIRLQSQPNLAALIDIGSAKHLAGTTITAEFPSYFIADPNGQYPAQVVLDMLRTWCDHALQLDDFEEELAGLGC